MLSFKKVYFSLTAYFAGVGFFHGVAVFFNSFDSSDGYKMLLPSVSGLSVFIFLIAGWLFIEGRIRAEAWPGSRVRSLVIGLLVLGSLALYLFCGNHGNWLPQFVLLLLSVPGYHGMGWISVLCGSIGIAIALIGTRENKFFSKELFIPGLAFLIFPTTLYLGGAVSQLWFIHKAQDFASNISINEFKEIPIIWPGFDGPVGIRIEFEVRHRKGFKAFNSPPWTVMGEIDEETRSKLVNLDLYYQTNGNNLARLGGNFYQRREKEYPNAFSPDAEVTHFAFNLYPGAVISQENKAHSFCLNPRSYGLGQYREEWRRHENMQEPIYSIGNDLSAYWVVRGPGGQFVDLSEMLTKELRGKSTFQNKPEEWGAMHKRFYPSNLLEKYAYERYEKREGAEDEHCYRLAAEQRRYEGSGVAKIMQMLLQK